jgi:hypothetical protein
MTIDMTLRKAQLLLFEADVVTRAIKVEASMARVEPDPQAWLPYRAHLF